MKDPGMKVKFTSEIIMRGTKPLYVVTAADQPSSPVMSHSASQVWKTILKKALGRSEYQSLKNNFSGSLYFGISNATVRGLIRSLPNADRALQEQQFMERSMSRIQKRRISDEVEEDDVCEFTPSKDGFVYGVDRV
jgi:hypothetical protein